MPSLVLDCRWLGRGGTGTVVSLLVRGLRDLHAAGAPPPFEPVLWGPASTLAALAWPGARVVDDRHDPHQWSGQRGGLRRPRGDGFGAMHQIRPFAAANVVQLLHDTIPLHVARSGAERLAKRAYLLAVARRSRFVVVPSEHSRRCVHEELGVPLDRVGVLHYPVDPDFVARVRGLRAVRDAHDAAADRPTLLYVGRFARHKNVDGLVEAFARTQAAADGARLVVAGGSGDEVARVQALAARLQLGGVTVLGSRTADELDALFAAADAVVMPSLEEGFGLPAWEGRALGLAVCASDAGALPEAAGPSARLFDPSSLDAMADALDDVVQRGAGRAPAVTAPTPADFAREYAAFALRVLGARG